MTRAQLEHAIRAACRVAEDSELWIFGSQAILGQFPDAPEAADKIDGALGELSQFHETYGFYVHGLSLQAAVLPEGWKDRTITIQNPNTKQYAGHCVEVHDLAASGDNGRIMAVGLFRVGSAGPDPYSSTTL